MLAPGGFYAPYRLQSLQHQLDTELRDLGAAMGATMSFRFDALPASFVPQSAYDDEAVLALIDARVPL